MSSQSQRVGQSQRDKVFVVTGSTMGIGEGIARRLASEAAAVVISGRSVDLGQRVAREIRGAGGRARFVRADVRVESDCVALIHAAVDHYGHLDGLINNAAIFPQISLADVTVELWDRVFAVNVRGAFFCTRAALPPLRQRGGGVIVNIGSTLVYRGSEARLAYACSKGALLTMTKTLARSLVSDHIRVNWVTVGWVATPGEIALRDEHSDDGDGLAYLEARAREAPLGRLETVEDIAAGVAYLVSDEASHVTGCELNISGGLWI